MLRKSTCHVTTQCLTALAAAPAEAASSAHANLLLLMQPTLTRITLHRGRPHLPSLLAFIQNRHYHAALHGSNSGVGGGDRLHADVEMGAPCAVRSGGSPASALKPDFDKLPLFTGFSELMAGVHMGPAGWGGREAANVPQNPATVSRPLAHGSSGTEGRKYIHAETALPEADADAAPLLAQPTSTDAALSRGVETARAPGVGGGRLEGGRMRVWVGGPEALWQSACAVCEELNQRERVPELEPVRVAHTH